MKKKCLLLILITLIALSTVTCGSSEEQSPKTRAQQKAEILEVDEELISNIFTACKSIGMRDPENSLNFYTPDFSGVTTISCDFIYESYVFTAIADTDYNITDISTGSMTFLQDGVVVADVYCLATDHQRTELQFQSEMDVKDNLISPATAEFPGHILEDSQWKIVRDGNTFTVSSWVDAQNEYGALLRYNFTTTYDWDGADDTEPVLIDVVISQ